MQMTDENKNCASTLKEDGGQGPGKKSGVIRKVLKWIGLGLLGLLIIVGLIFQAPWKVIALLVLFLLAHTVLPRRGLKWFWAGVGVVFIVLVIWVFLPEDDGEWRPYTFDEELAALEAKRAIPDEENAARIYNQLLESYDSNSFYVGLEESGVEVQKIPMREPWLSKEHPKIAAWVERHQTTIRTLLNAAKMEKCRFPINADPISFDYAMDRLPSMRKWAYLLISAANNDIGEGRISQAIEKGIAILRMSEHQYQQAAIIDLLVGNALEALACKQFNRIVMSGEIAEDNLRVIEEALSEVRFDWSSDFTRILEYEQLLHKNTGVMFYVINPEGRVRLSFGVAMRALADRLVEDMKKEVDLDIEGCFGYWRRRLMKAQTILAWFYMPSSPQKAGEVIDASYERYYAMDEADYNWEKPPAKLSRPFRLNYQYLVESQTDILAPAYRKIHDNYLRMVADKRGSRIIVALRRYKNANDRWPESLDELGPFASEEIFIDPVNNSTFVYKLTDDGFALYSKGKNGIDDGGKRERDVSGSCEPERIVDEGCDDSRIWPWGSKRKDDADGEQQ
jgi:energy-coupling factor transporter transmembrane protein EcfT